MSQNDSQDVRLAFVGVGGRGSNLLDDTLQMNDVSVPAVCDLSEENRLDAQNAVEASGRERPRAYHDYTELFDREDLDGVIIVTGWVPHVKIATHAMEQGVYAAFEVGPAGSVQECWDLVATHERTGVPCMLLENYCFHRDSMAVLNMVRQGVFGEIVHCECGYQHELQERLVLGKGTGRKKKGTGDYRTIHNAKRNGDIYPTHGLGPIARMLNVNRGNRFLSLTSTASKARGLRDWVENNLEINHPAARRDWAKGDLITTVIQCADGETVIVKHTTTIPAPMSRLGRVHGTRGVWSQESGRIHIQGKSPDHEWESFEAYQSEYEHPLWREYLTRGVKTGHGGGDFVVLRTFIESIKRGDAPPIDAYDAAVLLSIAPLSEQSIAMGSHPVAVPDFTSGGWLTAEPGTLTIFDQDMPF